MIVFLRQSTAAILGFLSGAMLLIALGLAQHWNAVELVVYRAHFQSEGAYLGQYMIPLMVAAILLSVACVVADHANRLRWLVPTILLIAIVPIYGFVHGPVNDVILGSTPLTDPELYALRSKWVFWHWVRTVLGMSAFLTSLRILAQPSGALRLF